MKDFLFAPQQARTPLRVLSGGERGRLMLARALAKPSNLLVLDEPTNDLDLETLDVLEEMLADYAGTVILISHDRDFLDRVVNAVLVPEGDGRWVEYAGGYTDMLAQRGADLAGTKATPKPKPPREAATPRSPHAPAKTASAAELPREARAGDPARADRRPAGATSAGCRSGWATPASTPATGRPSRRQRGAERRPRRSSPRPRSAGSSSRCCARSSRAAEPTIPRAAMHRCRPRRRSP